ncbi:MAG: FMN-binding negative transcriptional regulator [Pseudomonadota bacterium]|nr:FMN-binding negative transcriptional regulator [Pseudomonadota bacterium]
MYSQSAFKQDDTAELYQLIQDYSFGDLILNSPDGLHIHHLPFVLDEDKGCLYAHVAKGNSEWRVFQNEQEVTCVFKGENAYISPSWYASKEEHHKVVPTWNFRVVHVHGKCALHDDTEWLVHHLDQLTSKHEHHREVPWSIHDAPADFIQQLSKAIMGIEIKIESMQGKWKLGQNKPLNDIQGVIAGLRAEPNILANKLADETARYIDPK